MLLPLCLAAQGRTQAEDEKLKALAASRPAPKLWTPGFTILTIATVLTLAAIAYLTVTVAPGAELAVYDPFQVRRRTAAVDA